VPDVSTGSQQAICERSVAQGFGMRSDFERRRSGSLPRRRGTRQRFGVPFFPGLERFKIVLQIVEEAHRS
jgi:hypothetical protein